MSSFALSSYKRLHRPRRNTLVAVNYLLIIWTSQYFTFFYLILYYTPSSPNPVGTDESLRRRHTGPKDKKEDLQRLVEENEEAPEEDEMEGYAGTDNVVSATVKQTTPYEMFPDTLQMS